jgi:hypothetical protein
MESAALKFMYSSLVSTVSPLQSPFPLSKCNTLIWLRIQQIHDETKSWIFSSHWRYIKLRKKESDNVDQSMIINLDRWYIILKWSRKGAIPSWGRITPSGAEASPDRPVTEACSTGLTELTYLGTASVMIHDPSNLCANGGDGGSRPLEYIKK